MKFKIPQTLDGLSREQLVGLEAQAIEAFDAQRDDPNLDAAGMATLRALVEFINTARTAVTTADEATAAAAAELDAMVNLVHVPEPEDVADGEQPDEGDAQPDEAADAPETAADDDEADTDVPEVVEPEPITPPAARRVAEPVAAAAPALRPGSQVSLTRAAAGRTKPAPLGPTGRVILAAAADLPNYSNGHKFKDLKEVGEAVRVRLSGFPNQGNIPLASRTKMFLRQGIASITLPGNGLVADGRNDAEVIEAACDLSRLPGRSLVAAGAWCPPPVQLWDLCPSLISTDGMIDLPTFSFTRTGVTWPNVPSLIPDLPEIGFHYTEQDAINGTPKTCYTLPCTTWETAQMECDGICIKGDIINDSSWPEYYDRLLSDVLKLHQLKLSKAKLQRVIAASTPVNMGPGSDIDADNTMSGLYSAISLSAADYRRRTMASPTQELEVLLPSWLPEVAAADAARRGTCCTEPATTKSEISAKLAANNLRVQWISGWQDYWGNGAGLGAPTPAHTWPNQVQWIIYAPGAFAYGTRDIIRLDAVYDSTLLEQNEYIRLFSEQCSLFIHRCYPSYIYTQGLCPSGATAAPVEYSCAVTSIAATGATAGTPGTFTPSGAATPANLTALGSVEPSPMLTSWTTGQYVVLADSSHAYWDATAGWVTGTAP